MTDPRIGDALAPVTRRSFLKSFAWGSAGVLAAGAATVGWLGRSPRDAVPCPPGITALSAAEYHLFEAIAGACLPAAGNAAGLVAWRSLPVLANLDRIVATIPAHARGDVASAFRLLDWAPIVSGWHGRRFTDLDPADARAFLGQWNRGGEIARAVSNLARRLVYVAYWEEPATWPAIGYDGPVMARWGIPRYGNAPLPADLAPAAPQGV